MKKYLTILILFFSFTASAQIIYTPMSAGGYQMKYLKVDSGFALPFRDTTIGRGINRPGVLVVNPQDSILYIFNGKKWTPAYVDSTGVIGLIKNKVDSVTLSGNNLFYWSNGTGYGSQLNKLDSIYMSNDSIYTCIAGNCTFRYINSGLDSLAFHSASLNSDSTQLSLTRANGTKDTIEVVADGFVGQGGGGTYTLPTASSTVLGGVKVGSGLSIDGGGLLSGTYTASTGLTMVGTDIQLGGTLNNNTQINAGTNSLTLSGAVNNFTGVFTVNNTQSGYAIRASGSGNNVPTIYGTSSGMQSTAVAGTASGYGSDGVFGGSYNEYGGKFNSFIGVPLYAYRDSGTFGIDPVVQLVKTIHHPNQYYATNGMGQSIQFLQSDTNRVTGYSMPILNSIVSSWQDTLTGKSIFYIEGLANRTTTNRIFSLSGDGRTTLSKYGSGTFAGAPAYSLGVDASGNITETNLSKVTIKSTDPTTTDIPDGYSAVYKNSTSGNVYLWANIGGTLLKTQLN